MLLDSFAIPAAMVVSAVFLHARYTKMHGAGVLLCVTGLALTIVSDLGESNAVYTVHFLQFLVYRFSCISNTMCTACVITGHNIFCVSLKAMQVQRI
jgi:Solute carrier family 35